MEPYFEQRGVKMYVGDWIDVLRTIPDESVQCCVTSPPYWGLRDYDVPGQLGLERTPDEYVAKVVEGFREVRRVLRKDGTLWLNLGDTYAGSRCGENKDGFTGRHVVETDTFVKSKREGKRWGGGDMACPGLKPKDLIGIPWRVAFALQADGWYLRQDIIWEKPNPMPESVTDRCTKSHEYLFLLSKSAQYHCEMDAIKESCTAGDRGSSFTDEREVGLHPNTGKGPRKIKVPGGWDRGEGAHGTIHRNGRTSAEYQEAEVSPYRNKRSVWEIATSPFPEAHFATFPPKLVEPCILAGCPEGGTVLDPFFGAGTTGLVASKNGRKGIGVELNPEYVEMASRRLAQEVLQFT